MHVDLIGWQICAALWMVSTGIATRRWLLPGVALTACVIGIASTIASF